jgi:hypothetical protein
MNAAGSEGGWARRVVVSPCGPIGNAQPLRRA